MKELSEDLNGTRFSFGYGEDDIEAAFEPVAHEEPKMISPSFDYNLF